MSNWYDNKHLNKKVYIYHPELRRKACYYKCGANLSMCDRDMVLLDMVRDPKWLKVMDMNPTWTDADLIEFMGAYDTKDVVDQEQAWSVDELVPASIVYSSRKKIV